MALRVRRVNNFLELWCLVAFIGFPPFKFELKTRAHEQVIVTETKMQKYVKNV